MASGLSLPASAAEPAGWTYRLSLVASSDLNGRIAAPDCRPGGGAERTIGHLAASLAQARFDAEEDGRQVLTALHLGDLTGPAALGRFVFSGERGPERFARLVALTGIRHTVIGNGWLDQKADRLAVFGRELPRRGVAVLNANLACDGRPDCEVLADLPSQAVLADAPLRIALVGGTPEAALTVMDPAETRGLYIAPLVESLKREAAVARAAGADLVFAALHVVPGSRNAALLPELLRELDGVDLVFANQLGDLPETAAALQPPTGPALAVTGASTTTAVRFDIDVSRRERHLRITGLRASRVVASAPDPVLEGEARALVRDYCERWDRPLRVTAERAVVPREFLGTVLDEMRGAARAEVGVVNEDIADRSAFPLYGDVSTADVFAALPYEDVLVRVEVTGARLRALWKLEADRVAAGRPRLVWAGLSERDGELQVNERPLDPVSRYRIVMPDYLARGGDRLLGEAFAFDSLRWRDGEPLELRDLVLRGFSDPARPVRSVLAPLPLHLADKVRWGWRLGLTVEAKDTRRSNDPSYGDSRLARPPANALTGELLAQVDGDTRDHALRLSTRARYAQNHLRDPEPRVVKLEDRVFTEALYRLRRVRRLLDQQWYAPVPYLSLTLDTEFEPPVEAPFRRFEGGTSLGVRLLPWRPLEIKAGFSVRRELLDPAGRTRPGLELGYELPRFSPLRLQGQPITLESGFDYFVSDLGGNGERRHEGRFRAQVVVPIGGPLAVSAGYDAFLFRRLGQPLAWVSDFSFGIRLGFDGATQQF